MKEESESEGARCTTERKQETLRPAIMMGTFKVLKISHVC